MKFTITNITDYCEDEQAKAGDASHEGWGNVNSLYAEEYRRKVEDNEWPRLPYECEADSIEDAIDQYNEECCGYDYIKAEGADYETDED